LLKDGLQPFDVGNQEGLGASHTIMMLVTVRPNRQPPLTFYKAMVLVVPAVMRAAGERPLHADDQ
jgi:hypothetical protein